MSGNAGFLRFADVFHLWEDGQRRLQRAEPADRGAMERVVDELVHELSRRIGGSFMTQELVDYYLDRGTDWCFDIATRVAPSNPAAWDLTTVAGAAFARYVREASDFASRRAGIEEE